MGKKVFILGNGFDINIGWKTKYSDYVYSSYWPLANQKADCSLGQYLAQNADIERWFDLEEILRLYASGYSQNLIADKRDEYLFVEIVRSLTEYIRSEEKKCVDNNSVAIRVLKAVVENGYFSSIYSFNYTDLSSIAYRVGIDSDIKYSHVHGNVKDNTIILGIDDKVEVRKGYEFLRKVYNPHYESHHLRYDLQECEEVVIFGHSLGDIDYWYFGDFFEKQCRCIDRRDSKRITIFTKDHKSRIQILEQLRIMNGAQTERLINDNDFWIITTDAPDNKTLDRFLKHLKEDSVSSHDKALASIASKF